MVSTMQTSSRAKAIESDREVIEIIEKIYQCYEDASELVGPLGNIFSVFFHDLVIHFSGILILRATSGCYVDVPQFPYIEKRYSVSPYKIEHVISPKLKAELTYKKWIREIQFIPLAIGNSLPYGHKQQRLISKLVSLLGAFQRPVKVFLPKRKQQIDMLLTCIGELCSDYQVPMVDVVQNNWLRYVEANTIGEQRTINQECVILGNRQDLQNRKLAVNFLQQEKQVVAFTHGEIASTVFDEPMYDYAERSLCSTLVEYGRNYEDDRPKYKAFVRPNTTLYRTSLVAEKRYLRNDTIEPKQLNESRVLYIPTTYLGSQIYGPFHAYEDSVYRDWHLALVEAIPYLIVKAHPKSIGPLQPPGRLERRWLDDCVKYYDVLIIDYMATAAVLSVVSDKPIIYFDIGLRRLSERFSSDLHARCQCARIDINGNLREQILASLEKYNHTSGTWSNLNIEKYIVDNTESFSWRKLLHNALRSE